MRQPSLRAAGANQCSIVRAQPGFGADAAQDDDLAARLEHAGELVERGFRIRHRGDDILRDHDVEASCPGKSRCSASMTSSASTWSSPSSATRSRALSSIASEMSTPTMRVARANSPAARCRCRRRPRGCGRRSARPPRSRRAGRARTPARTPGRRPAPSGHRPSRRACLSMSIAIATAFPPLRALRESASPDRRCGPSLAPAPAPDGRRGGWRDLPTAT